MAAVDWVAVAKSWRRLEYLAKPAVMAALLAWLWSYAGFEGPLIWFGLAVFLSLAGDVFLMLAPRFFIPGLVSFLSAHLAYIAGFNSTLPPVEMPALLAAVFLLLVGILLYRKIAAGLLAKKLTVLRLPILIYSLVISLMLISALLTNFRPEWGRLPALLVTAGALLFFISDSLLALDRFAAPIPHGRLLVMVSYHLGQISLIAGAGLNYIHA